MSGKAAAATREKEVKTATATVQLADAPAVLQAVTKHLAEHEIELRTQGSVTRASLRSGEMVMRLDPPALRLEAHASGESDLEHLVSFLASHVIEFAHPEQPDIAWSGYDSGRTPSDFREMRVIDAWDIAADMRRVRLGGNDLGRFASLEDIHVRLLFPQPGTPPVWPRLNSNGMVEQARDPALRPAERKYTIRNADADAGWVDIDFVLHEAPGPGSDWARGAAAGDVVGMAGPGGRSARQADYMLLAGDETALPAIARTLEMLEPHTRGVALIEVGSSQHAMELQAPSGMELRWLERGSAAGLAAAVMQIEIPSDLSCFCWAGAEFSDVQAIRRHWKESCGLDKSNQLAVAYWRMGLAGFG